MMEPMKKLNDQAQVEEQEVTTKDIGSQGKDAAKAIWHISQKLELFQWSFSTRYTYPPCTS